jgi:hypothetical protein
MGVIQEQLMDKEPAYQWLAIYHALMFELEFSGLMTPEGRKVFSLYKHVSPDHPQFMYVAYRADVIYPSLPVGDDPKGIYTFLLHGPIFEVVWKLSFRQCYLVNGRFARDHGPCVKKTRDQVLEELLSIYPHYTLDWLEA